MGRSSTTDHKRFSSIGIIKSRRVFCAFHRKHSYYFHKQANSCGEAKRRKKLNLKKYQNTSRQMVGWNSKTILRKPSCVFVLLKWNLTLKNEPWKYYDYVGLCPLLLNGCLTLHGFHSCVFALRTPASILYLRPL